MPGLALKILLQLYIGYEELNETTSAELLNILHNLNEYAQKILYYGPQPWQSLAAV